MPADPETTLADEFASTMQQLVAEAERGGARESGAESYANASDNGLAYLAERIGSLERILSTVAKKISSPVPTEAAGAVVGQLQRMEEQMAQLCQTESVNHRLFNSLHQELKSYRDNFLRESLQKPFIRDLVMLFDDLSNLAAQMESAAGSSKKANAAQQWSTNLQNAVQALLEVLHRMDVNPIEAREFVDRGMHRVVSYEPAEFVEDDGRIVLRVKRGFIWRDQVLRPEEVVAKRFG
jgi:molecular chaperone GrpE (heat shock protein)